MKKYLGREVIERARRGSANRSLKARKVGLLHLDAAEWQDWEYDGPGRVPNSHMQAWDSKIGDKDFSDTLGPIHGYLRSNLGRPWDDVFSELSAGLGAFSWPLRHILTQHVDVATHTWMGNDGKVYVDDKYGISCVSEMAKRYDFYVHPRDGRLRQAPMVRWRTISRLRPTRWETDRKKMDDGRWLVKIDGLWYIGTYRKRELGDNTGMDLEPAEPLPSALALAGTLMLLKPKRYFFPHARRMVGTWPHSDSEVFCKVKQANRKELRVLATR